MHTHGICLSPLWGAGDKSGWGLREEACSLSLGHKGLHWLNCGDRGRGGLHALSLGNKVGRSLLLPPAPQQQKAAETGLSKCCTWLFPFAHHLLLPAPSQPPLFCKRRVMELRCSKGLLPPACMCLPQAGWGRGLHLRLPAASSPLPQVPQPEPDLLWELVP